MLKNILLSLILSVHASLGSTTLIGIDFGEFGGAAPPEWNELLLPPTGTVAGFRDLSGQATSVTLSYSGSFDEVSGAPLIGTAVPISTTDLTTVLQDHFSGQGATTVLLGNLDPITPYYIWVMGGMRLPGFDNLVTITGAGAPRSFRQGAELTTFGESFINTELGSSSRTFSSYAQMILASPSGTIEIGWQTGASGPDAAWAISGIAIQPIPEPDAVFLLIGGSALLSIYRRRRQRR